VKEYVLIGFDDGDARVYDPDGAEEQMQANGFSDVRRTELARGNDRLVLVEMAVLARGNRGRSMVDMTAECGDREVALRRKFKKGGLTNVRKS
jgi:hypothetical protein